MTVASGSPTYQFPDVPGATYFYLYVARADGSQVVINEVIDDVGYCNGQTCSIDPTILREQYRLTNGAYIAYWRSWSNGVAGAWNGPFAFNLNATPPGLVTMQTPLNTNRLRPTFRWTLSNSATNATTFRVYVGPTANVLAPVIDQQISRVQACGSVDGTTCLWVAPLDLIDGTTYCLYIQGSGPGGITTGGISGFAGPETFLVDAPTPNLPAGINVILNQGRPTITWNDDLNASHFIVYVAPQADVLSPILNQPYLRTTVGLCNGTTCSLTPTVNLMNTMYSVYIRAYGAGGYSTGGISGYGGPVNFTLTSPVPDITGTGSLSPTGTITSGSPTFQWNTVANANNYELFVGQPAPTYFPSIHLQQYAASVICTTHPGTCSVSPDLLLAEGNYAWTVRALGSGGVSSWYNLPNIVPFTVDSAVPAVVVLNTPVDAATVTTNTPAFSWADNPVADYYNLYVATSSGTVLYNQWNRATRGSGQLCNGGVCSLTISGVTLANVSHVWSVRAYTPTGIGAYSLPARTFSVAVPAAGVPVLQQPADSDVVYSTNRPTFVWGSASGATSYTLTIRNGMNTVVFTQNYPGSGCTTTCTVQVPNPLSYGSYNWQVTAINQGGSAVSSTFDFLSLSINTQPMMVQSEDTQVSGQWVEQADASALGNSYFISDSTEDVLALRFSGSALDVVYVVGPNYGSFQIEVDGIIRQVINASADTTIYGMLVHVSDLGEGEHTLRIVPTSELTVAIDAIVVDGQVIAGEIVTLTPLLPTPIPTVTLTPEPTLTLMPTITSAPTIFPTEEIITPTVELPTNDASPTP